jgi:hypothetical protein
MLEKILDIILSNQKHLITVIKVNRANNCQYNNKFNNKIFNITMSKLSQKYNNKNIFHHKMN